MIKATGRLRRLHISSATTEALGLPVDCPNPGEQEGLVPIQRSVTTVPAFLGQGETTNPWLLGAQRKRCHPPTVEFATVDVIQAAGHWLSEFLGKGRDPLFAEQEEATLGLAGRRQVLTCLEACAILTGSYLLTGIPENGTPISVLLAAGMKDPNQTEFEIVAW